MRQHLSAKTCNMSESDFDCQSWTMRFSRYLVSETRIQNMWPGTGVTGYSQSRYNKNKDNKDTWYSWDSDLWGPKLIKLKSTFKFKVRNLNKVPGRPSWLSFVLLSVKWVTTPLTNPPSTSGTIHVVRGSKVARKRPGPTESNGLPQWTLDRRDCDSELILAIHLFRVHRRHVRWEGTSQKHKYTCNF